MPSSSIDAPEVRPDPMTVVRAVAAEFSVASHLVVGCGMSRAAIKARREAARRLAPFYSSADIADVIGLQAAAVRPWVSDIRACQQAERARVRAIAKRKRVAALKPARNPRAGIDNDPEPIIQRIADQHGVAVVDILRRLRTHKVYAARKAAVRAVAAANPRMLPHDLGQVFGRDRTTIIHILGRAPSKRSRRILADTEVPA